MSEEIVRYETNAEIAVVTVDDGRANALSHPVLDALSAALDRAAKEEAKAIVMTGRGGRFCAGFDLDVMMSGASQRRMLVEAGARLFLRMYEFPRPIVLACTGHALAAGAVWLTACDWRVGADIEAKIGLNEVAIGLPLPIFALELARARLVSHRILDATAHARIYTPRQAVEVGYLDEVTDPASLMSAAMERAAALGALRDPAYSHTKHMVRAAVGRHIRDTLEEDMDRIG